MGGDSLSVEHPTEEAIERAAAALRAGRLVGMPTETVYGVAANAFDPSAVEATFRLKGRPADNPLIVHLSSLDELSRVATQVPLGAQKLAEAFWPGPLTLVLHKRPEVPSVVTGGLATVAIRVPAHPVALALLRAADLPASAPSANKFTALSPTRAEDIDPEIVNSLEIVLNGGPCEIGIESTVLDLTGAPAILRPGAVSAAQVEAILGRPVGTGVDRRSPGMYPKHYAPKTPLRLADRLEPGEAGLTLGAPDLGPQIQMSGDPREYASRLYAALAELDRMGVAEIVVERPPLSPEWSAVNDRLTKAARSSL